MMRISQAHRGCGFQPQIADQWTAAGSHSHFPAECKSTLDGTLVRTAAGAEILTNGFELRDQTIHVWDFNDRPYVFDIASGAERVE